MTDARDTVADRARALVELSALERSMRTLLSMVEARATDLDGLRRAAEALETSRVDPLEVVERFRGAAPVEIAMLKRRLTRIADLDAVLRATCHSEMATTAVAIDRLRTLRVKLAALAPIESVGDALDFVR